MTLSEFGAQLRQAREEKGISVASAADALKLNEKLLHALEEGDLASLPQAAFTTNFCRAYALFLGMPREEVLKSVGEIKELAAVRPLRPAYERVVTPSSIDVARLLRTLIPLLLVALLGLCVYGLYTNWDALKNMVSSSKTGTVEVRDSSSPESVPPAAPEADARLSVPGDLPADLADAPASAPAAAAPSAPAESPDTAVPPAASAAATPDTGSVSVTPAAGPNTLIITAQAKCWLAYRVDKDKTTNRVLQKGDTLALAYEDTLRVVFGNVGGVRLTHNGREMDQITSKGTYTLYLPPQQ